MKAISWLLGRRIEVAVFLLGMLLRLSMVWNYEANWSFDSDDHWEVVRWIAERGRVPPPEAAVEAFHPPLWYSMSAWLLNHGVAREQMVWVSLLFGTIRLAIIWIGLELYVKGSRLARVTGLTLAAVMYATVHIDGMVYTEALSCLLNAMAMLLVPIVFRRRPMERWPMTLGLGVIYGLAILTKISSVATITAVGLAVVIEFFHSRRSLSERVSRALPWVAIPIVVTAMSGWYYARNVREYGRPFITSFDLPSQHYLVEEAEKHAYLDRRTLGFILGWDKSVYIYPFSQPGIGPNPRFFPVAIASAFQDFWGYAFQGYVAPIPKPGEPRVVRSLRSYVNVGRIAVMGGTVIFGATVVAWLCSWRRLWKSMDIGRIALLLFPFAVTLAALHFTITCPADGHGVTKGVYLMYGAPPLFGLFGIAVAWTQRRRERWPLFVGLLVALALVAAYTLDCRLGLRLWSA